MGFFFSDPVNRIQFHELDKHLSKMQFSRAQRDEAKELFKKHKGDGISKAHIKKIARSLKNDYKDRFNSYHAERLEKGLLGVIEDRMKPKIPVEKNTKPAQVYEFKRPTFKQTPPPPEKPSDNELDFKSERDFRKIA